jgi:hypothetical protein
VRWPANSSSSGALSSIWSRYPPVIDRHPGLKAADRREPAIREVIHGRAVVVLRSANRVGPGGPEPEGLRRIQGQVYRGKKARVDVLEGLLDELKRSLHGRPFTLLEAIRFGSDVLVVFLELHLDLVDYVIGSVSDVAGVLWVVVKQDVARVGDPGCLRGYRGLELDALLPAVSSSAPRLRK